jgi:hypothetical protein
MIQNKIRRTNGTEKVYKDRCAYPLHNKFSLYVNG